METEHLQLHSQLPVPIQSQINPVQAPSYFSKVYFNINLPSMPTIWSSIFSSCLSTKAPYAPPLFSIRVTRPVCLVLLDLISWKYLGRSTDHESPHHAVSTSPLVPDPFYAQIPSSSPPCARIVEFIPSHLSSILILSLHLRVSLPCSPLRFPTNTLYVIFCFSTHATRPDQRGKYPFKFTIPHAFYRLLGWKSIWHLKM